MIQPLRTAHHRAFLGLAILLPAILGAGLGFRHEEDRADRTRRGMPAERFVTKKSDRMWRRHMIVTEFYGEAGNAAAYVALRTPEDLNEPDLLLYWQGAAQPDDVLSPDARLLGAFEPEKIFLLDVNAAHTGRLVLYSGAHHSIVDESLIEKLP